MGTIILTMQASLDGIVSDVDDWMSLNDEILEDTLAYYETVDAIVIGGKTYPSLAQYWQQAEEASESALERQVAKRINEIEKLVLSRSNIDLNWRNSRQLPVHDDDSFIEEFTKLRDREGLTISVESGVGVWHLFVKHALFDDIWMWVHPVVAGRGDRLFADVPAKMPLYLSSSKVCENGVVLLHYEKKR